MRDVIFAFVLQSTRSAGGHAESVIDISGEDRWKAKLRAEMHAPEAEVVLFQPDEWAPPRVDHVDEIYSGAFDTKRAKAMVKALLRQGLQEPVAERIADQSFEVLRLPTSGRVVLFQIASLDDKDETLPQAAMPAQNKPSLLRRLFGQPDTRAGRRALRLQRAMLNASRAPGDRVHLLDGIDDHETLVQLFAECPEIMVQALVLQRVGDLRKQYDWLSPQDLGILNVEGGSAELSSDAGFRTAAIRRCGSAGLAWAAQRLTDRGFAEPILQHALGTSPNLVKALSRAFPTLDAFYEALTRSQYAYHAVEAIPLFAERPDLMDAVFDHVERRIAETDDPDLHQSYLEALKHLSPEARAARDSVLEGWLKTFEEAFARTQEEQYEQMFHNTVLAVADPQLIIRALKRVEHDFAAKAMLQPICDAEELLIALRDATANPVVERVVRHKLFVLEGKRRHEALFSRWIEETIDQDAEMRENSPPEPIVSLSEMLNRPSISADDRAWAEAQTHESGDGFLTARLRKLSREVLEDLQREPEAVQGLGYLRDPLAVPALLRAIGSTDPRVAANATWVLSRHDAPEEADAAALAKAARHSAPEVRRVALEGLLPLPNFMALPAFIEALTDPDQVARATAVTAIRRRLASGAEIADPTTVIRHLRDALADWDAGQDALGALRALDWTPTTAADRVHVYCAERNGAALRAEWDSCRRVLLADVRSGSFRRIEHAVLIFIALGEDEILTELVRTIERHGEKPMADAYLNCGHERLHIAALDWADRNGHEVVSGAPVRSVGWGQL